MSRKTVQAGLQKLIESGVMQRFSVEVDRGAGVEIVLAVTLIEVQGILNTQRRIFRGKL